VTIYFLVAIKNFININIIHNIFVKQNTITGQEVYGLVKYTHIQDSKNVLVTDIQNGRYY